MKSWYTIRARASGTEVLIYDEIGAYGVSAKGFLAELGALHAGKMVVSLVAAGFAVRSQIIWAKDRLVLSRGDYHWQHEPCWYSLFIKGRGHWAGDRSVLASARFTRGHAQASTLAGQCDKPAVPYARTTP